MSQRISRASGGTKYSDQDMKKFFRKVQLKRRSEVSMSNDKVNERY